MNYSSAQDERDQLILEHVSQVKLVARRIHERLPAQSVNLDDLISAGMLGLISAIDHFDVSRSVKLKTYAEYKIKGAILDCLRELDWAPRQHRKRAREIEAAVLDLEQELQRTPSEEEIANYLGLSIPEYQECAAEVLGMTLGGFNHLGNRQNGERGIIDDVVDENACLPSQIAERAELTNLLTEQIGRMPKLEQTILGLYYYQEMTLREISNITGLNQSRISQVKTKAIQRLRAGLEMHFDPRLNKDTSEVQHAR